MLHEVDAHEPNVDQVKATAEELINADHFASDEIQLQLLQLQSSWRDLKLQSTKRTQKLTDSEESQKVHVHECIAMVNVMLVKLFFLVLSRSW